MIKKFSKKTKQATKILFAFLLVISWFLSSWPRISKAQTPDFNIQRRCEFPATGTVTLTAGTDYTAPASNTSAFIRMMSTRLSGMGDTVGGGTQEADDWTWYISDPDFAGGSVVFTRAGTTNPQRFCWEIIEYVGAASGANEMIVRGVGTATYTTTGLTVDGGSVTVTDDADVAVFITGQNSVEVAIQYEVAAGQSTAEWVAASDIPRFTRGIANSDANSISYAVVEFTGSNWAVERIQHQFTLAGTTETETITDVGDLSRAFFHAQYRRGDAGGLDEAGAEMWLSLTNQASFFLQSGAGVPTNKYGVIWIIRNSDTTASTKMNVQHLSGSRAAAGVSEGAANEEDEWTDAITAVGDTAQTSIMGESGRSAGTGSALPRGWISLYLNSTTGVKLYQSDDGQPQTYRFQVAEWPESSSSQPTLAQNNYRWYVDSDLEDVTDPWGNPDIAQNTAIAALPVTNDPPGATQELRLRVNISVSNANMTASSKYFKFQYKQGTDGNCTTGTWTDVGAGGGGEIWRYATSGVTDGTDLTNSRLSPASDVLQEYIKSKPTGLNPFAVNLNQTMEYDFHIEQNGASDAARYSFRVVETDNTGTPTTVFNGYTNCPTLTTEPGTGNLLRHGNFFADEVEQGFFWAN